jgi:GGDEF domain-containing protein
MHLNLHKNIEQLMDRTSLIVEENTPLENVAQRIQSRKSEFLYDDVCVTKSGKYFGTVAISELLDAITEKSIALARGANPLSGLPGNEVIQREINVRLSQGMHFDVCYIDIDNFKPYNDHYGFERGDMVIKTLADILRHVIMAEPEGFSFVGHIGGDDFIVITRPHVSMPGMEKVLERFGEEVPMLHGDEDYARGFYLSKNRRGEEERFNHLSLSIGIVSTEVNKIESYAQLASIATEVKKAAKALIGSSIVRDKRLQG